MKRTQKALWCSIIFLTEVIFYAQSSIIFIMVKVSKNIFLKIIGFHHTLTKFYTSTLKHHCYMYNVCSNRTCLQNQLWSRSLILRNLFLAEPIFKVDSLNLVINEPAFRYRYSLIFLDEFKF